MALAQSIAAILCLLALALPACGGDGGGSDNPEDQAIRGVISTFVLEAFDDGGDVGVAYDLLDSETRKSCTIAEFRRLAAIGRGIVAGRELSVRSIDHITVSEELATAQIRVTMGRTNAYFLHEAVTVVKQAEAWRYRITFNPECDDAAEFFDSAVPVKGTQ